MTAFIIETALKTTVAAAVALVLLGLARSWSPAARAQLARLGVLAVALTPLAVLLIPAWRLALPPFGLDRLGIDWTPELIEGLTPVWTPWLYLGPMLVLAIHGLFGLAQLGVLRSRAEVVVDPAWTTALAEAQQRSGLKTGVALLNSSALPSPVSWGLLRPTIVLSSAGPQALTHARAIVAHELAHIQRLDWLTLIIARAATTLFWFNPIVWRLAELSGHLCEEAADDAVLTSDVIAPVDYAGLLVASARRRVAALPLPLQSVAPASSSLTRRVSRVLSWSGRGARPRRFATAPAIVVTLAVTGCLGAVQVAPAEHRPAADNPARTAEAAAARLTSLDHPQAHALGRALERANWNERRAVGPSVFYEPGAVEALVEASHDGRPVNRRIALWGLGELEPSRTRTDPAFPVALQALRKRLADPDARVRELAARALAEHRDLDSFWLLIAALDDGDPHVRANAAHALGDLQRPEAIGPLSRMIADPEPRVRDRAAWALARCREGAAILAEVSPQPR